MDLAAMIRKARLCAGLTQAALAARAGTSQATLSAYESGRKQPSAATLARLLAAAGMRLVAEPAPYEPTPAEHARTARQLADVLALAAALPTRHEAELRYPRLAT